MVLRHTSFLRAAIAVLATTGVLLAAGHSAEAGAAVLPTVAVAPATAWIAAEAERLSGRQLTVTCAPTEHAWAAETHAAGLSPSGKFTEVYGFSLIETGAMYLNPYVCDGLRLGLDAASRRGSHAAQVAWAVNVLVHESVHLARRTYDEALTEACARVDLPLELHRLYGVAYRSPELRALTRAAAGFRRTMAEEYQGGTCPPAQ